MKWLDAQLARTEVFSSSGRECCKHVRKGKFRAVAVSLHKALL